MKKLDFKITLSILLLSGVLQSRNVISLVLNEMAQTFPEKSTASIQLIFSISTGAGIIGALLAGKMANVMTKKNISAVFSVITLAGALIGCCFSRNYVSLLLSSTIIGIGIGTLTPISSAMIAEYYEGVQRTFIMGIQSIAVSGGGALLTLLAGYLVGIKWNYVYMSFFVLLPIGLLLFLLLPQGRIEKAESEGKIKVLTPALVWLLVEVFFLGVGLMTFTGNISFAVAALGEKYAVWAGHALSVFMVAGVIAGLILPVVMKKLKESAMGFGLFLAVAGLFCLAFLNSIVTLILCAFLFGLGFGLYMPAGFTMIAESMDPAASTMAMSLFTSFQTLGCLLNPYIVTTFSALINDKISTRFLLSAVFLSLVLLAKILFKYGKRTAKV